MVALHPGVRRAASRPYGHNVDDRRSLPAPVVTVRNPSGSAPEPEQLTLAEPGWTTEQRRWAWQGLAALLVLAAGVWSAVATAHDRDRDRRELAAVALSAVADAGRTPDLALELLNQGPAPLEVVSARVVSPGFRSVEAAANTLQPGDPQRVVFRAGSCPASATADLGAAVEVRVRTLHGATRTLTYRGLLDGSFVGAFVSRSMQRCGLYAPAFSLEVSGTSVRRVGRDLDLSLIVRNLARHPRTLQQLMTGGGLTVTRQHPLPLGGGAAGSTTLRLHVADCGAALVAWGLVPQQQGFTPTYRGVEATGSLDADVLGDGRSERAVDLLAHSGYDVRTWVRDVCAAG